MPRSPGGSLPDRVESLLRRTGGQRPSRRPVEDEPLPERYQVRESKRGRFLRCTEAPGVRVSIDRSHSFTEAEARKLGERVVLVDGAGRFPPLLDNEKLLYNLDHHEGCPRAFTLAACEQALLVVLKGLELDQGTWTVYANDPDLDTLFALWVLLNHRRLRDLEPERRDDIVPLLRLEGAIDANGFELAEWCGLTRETLERAKPQLDRLQERELEAKRSGEWEEGDAAAYAAAMLGRIDHLVYRLDDFDDFLSVEEEYEHVEIGGNRVAVICRDESGIYEVEKRLKKLWGERLGIVVLEKARGHFTVRRAAALSVIDLEATYRRLNLIDPAVDGRPPDKRWGGSDEIGGSPRPGGTGLEPREIAAALQDVHQPPGRFRPLARAGSALGATVGLAAAAGASLWAWWSLPGLVAAADSGATEVLVVGLAFAVVAAILSWRSSGGRLWLFGWRLPAARDWLLAAPLSLAGAALGGAWTPIAESGAAVASPRVLAALAASALGLEAWNRGYVHGCLLFCSPVEEVGGRWFLSAATWTAAVTQTVLTLLAFPFLLVDPPLAVPELDAWMVVALASMASGLAQGVVRERSLSLWPGVVLLFAGGWLGLLLR